ncbi:EAL domain-containing protein [Nitrogeniibacter aestuarii]|uniref:EAL domain-containing protein n=1 Tax=Nitrogeniibacter aestuarii TaxID=2815343 RepID=UPI001E33865F|nr:EAL domain-containing protein [Nitrogeniibacter aestuarii]
MSEAPRPSVPVDVDAELARRDKIIEVLMDRVERGMDARHQDYSFFEKAIVLGQQVEERTRELGEALKTVRGLNTALAHESREAAASQARLMAAIGASSDGFALFDATDALVLSNPVLDQVFGDELIVEVGQTHSELIRDIRTRDWALQWNRVHVQARRGSAVRDEVRLSDGRWLRISEQPTPDGGIVGIYTDITEMKTREMARREHALAQQAVLLQTTLDNLEQGVLVLDARDRLVAWNQRVEQMLASTQLQHGMPFERLPVLGTLPALRNVSETKDELELEDSRILSIVAAGMPDGGRVITLSDITEKRRQAARIQNLADELRLIYDNAHVGIAYVRDRVIVNCNSRMAEMFGWASVDDLTGLSTRVIYRSDEEFESRGEQIYSDLDIRGYSDRLDWHARADGGEVWCQRTGRLIHPQRPQDGSIWVFADMTDRREQERKLHLAQTVFAHCAEALMVTDANGVIIDVNAAFSMISGYERDEVVGQTPRLLKSNRHGEEFYKRMWHRLTTVGSWSGEVWDRRKNGPEYPKWLSIAAVRDQDGTITHYVAAFEDVTSRKEAEQRIRDLAEHDHLTGLPNRLLLRDRFDLAIKQHRRQGHNLGFMFLDLDHFKRVNDSLGHPTGDRLLIAVVERLRTVLREGDTISRLGGDEFVILLNDIGTSSAAAAIAEKIIMAFKTPIDIGGNPLVTSASIGIAMAPQDGEDFDALLQRADTAMYRAKEQGRGGFAFFRKEMNEAATSRLRLVNALHDAIGGDQFHLVYQPLVSTDTRRIECVEALMRWNCGGRPIPPDEFIPIAEETGLILPMGEWIMETACQQARRWRDAGHDLRIAVNVSGIQLYRTDIPALLAKHAAAAGIPPSAIEIEITESTLMHDSAGVEGIIADIKRLGSSVAIDDFGTGYSSLAYLSRFKADKLKIDRSFIDKVETSEEDRAIVQMVANIARVLKMHCVAEGVENAQQLDYIRQCGCDTVQGYFISRPVPAVQMDRLFRQASEHQAA